MNTAVLRSGGTRRPVRILSSGLTAGALVAGTLAITVAGTTTTAEAATNKTWNRLARCESGGNWHINTGNGYYGGLQFSASTWRAYGGGKFASYAHRASRREQIIIAERVLRAQGWGAWPACSSRLGLTRADAKADSKGRKRPKLQSMHRRDTGRSKTNLHAMKRTQKRSAGFITPMRAKTWG